MLFVPLICPLRFFVVVVVDPSWAVRENFALCSREDSTAQLGFSHSVFPVLSIIFLLRCQHLFLCCFHLRLAAPICSSQIPLCRLNFLLLQLPSSSSWEISPTLPSVLRPVSIVNLF
jgi:hypothetical protein